MANKGPLHYLFVIARRIYEKGSLPYHCRYEGQTEVPAEKLSRLLLLDGNTYIVLLRLKT